MSYPVSSNGKEKWKTKKKYTIKWKKGKAGTYVKIQLLKKGKLYRTIKAKTKKIFAKVSGNSRKAKIVALHANKDKKIDWLVIWSDGTYGTLIAR